MSNQKADMPLSKRQLQVLQMIATGASNQDIARELVISIHTVKTHVRNIFEKMDVQSRTEASLRAIQAGWVVVNNVIEEEQEQKTIQTYLQTTATKRPPLATWQHIYLISTILLVLLLIATPPLLAEKYTNRNSTYLPIIKSGDVELLYKRQPTITPLPPSTSNQWVSQAPMPTYRAGLGLVVFNDYIFAIGGVRTNDRATRIVDIYNPKTNSWSEGAAKPTAATDISATVLGDKIYVPGGCNNAGQTLDIMEIYDPKADKWMVGQPLPQPRCGYGLAVLGDSLYLFGGWDGQAYTDTIFVFSATDNKWTVSNSVMPTMTGYAGVAVVHNEMIYLVGGYDGQNESDKSWLFMPDSGEWVAKSAMSERRGGLGLVSSGNFIYAVGGGWNNPLDTSEKYDPQTDRWTTFEAPFTTQWRNLGLVAVGTQIYAVGGWNEDEEKYMDSIVSYQVIFQMFLPIR